MAGKKGMKGGGGSRPCAGRKKKPAAKTVKVEVPMMKDVDGNEVEPSRDPLEFLLDVMQGRIEANAAQVRAGVAAVQYVHLKKGDGGVKDAKIDAAKKAASGRFAASAPPKLVANNGKAMH